MDREGYRPSINYDRYSFSEEELDLITESLLRNF